MMIELFWTFVLWLVLEFEHFICMYFLSWIAKGKIIRFQMLRIKYLDFNFYVYWQTEIKTSLDGVFRHCS